MQLSTYYSLGDGTCVIVVVRAVRLLEQLQLLVIVASQSQLCD